jgi:hypothetical protein
MGVSASAQAGDIAAAVGSAAGVGSAASVGASTHEAAGIAAARAAITIESKLSQEPVEVSEFSRALGQAFKAKADFRAVREAFKTANESS